MNLRKLTTLLFAGVTAATPFTTNAQNPTILQGNYVSNVFGQANFVLNPNAQTNTANVTLTTATATRSTTTPLVATSEYNVTITSANGTAAWATRTFDAGMKNQNCEARFTYRGFQATSKAQIKQGANVVAELVLTPSATDPRIASINFPCGDLSSATTFVITDTATLAGTNEIGGIYVGLATNQANVAQAQTVVKAYQSAAQSIPNNTLTTVIYDTETLDVYDEYNPSTGVFTPKQAGQYLIDASVLSGNVAWSIGEIVEIQVTKNTSPFCRHFEEMQATNTAPKQSLVNCVVDLQVGDTLRIDYIHQQGAALNLNPSSVYTFVHISRFPSSSELVVTPETQNVFGSIKQYNGQNINNALTAATWTTLSNATSWTKTWFGQAKQETTNDVKLTIDNMPVGSYYVTVTGLFYTKSGASGDGTECVFGIADTSTGGAQIASMEVQANGDVSIPQQNIIGSTFGGVYKNTSLASRSFFVQAYRQSGTGSCLAYTDVNRPITITVMPLDNDSNSALYVQGPVKSSGTGTASPTGFQGEEISGTSTSGTGANCATITVTPGQWILYGMAFTTLNPLSGTVAYDIEIDDSSGTFSASTGSFTRTLHNVVADALLSTVRIVRTSSTKTYYLNCRVAGILGGTATKTNNTSVIKAVRLN